MRSPASAPPSQKTVCISRTVVGQQGHSLLQNSTPDEEERDCAPNKRKTITWTPDAFLNSLGHDWGFSINEGFTKEKVQQDLVTYNGQHLGPAPQKAPTPRMPMQNLRYRRLRGPPPHLLATCRSHDGGTRAHTHSTAEDIHQGGLQNGSQASTTAAD